MGYEFEDVSKPPRPLCLLRYNSVTISYGYTWEWECQSYQSINTLCNYTQGVEHLRPYVKPTRRSRTSSLGWDMCHRSLPHRRPKQIQMTVQVRRSRVHTLVTFGWWVKCHSHAHRRTIGINSSLRRCGIFGGTTDVHFHLLGFYTVNVSDFTLSFTHHLDPCYSFKKCCSNSAVEYMCCKIFSCCWFYIGSDHSENRDHVGTGVCDGSERHWNEVYYLVTAIAV